MSLVDVDLSLAHIEVIGREPRSSFEEGVQPSLENGLIFNGKHLMPYKPPMYEGGGSRDLFLTDNGVLIKAEFWGSQGEQEARLWDDLEPGDEDFFQPILAFQSLDFPYLRRPHKSKQVEPAIATLDVVLVPFIKFDPDFRPDLEADLRNKADALAEKYRISDWGWQQYKPINQGTSFIIHDYGIRR